MCKKFETSGVWRTQGFGSALFLCADPEPTFKINADADPGPRAVFFPVYTFF